VGKKNGERIETAKMLVLILQVY
jgi:hypothetical protein